MHNTLCSKEQSYILVHAVAKSSAELATTYTIDEGGGRGVVKRASLKDHLEVFLIQKEMFAIG